MPSIGKILILVFFLSIKSLLAQTSDNFSTQQVTAFEYADFLNHVAASDPHHLYDEAMGLDPYAACIARVGELGSYRYFVFVGKENYPITHVNFFDEARYCNWLDNGQPTSEQDPECTEVGAYYLNEIDDEKNCGKIFKTQTAKYFILDKDENDDPWLKSNQKGFQLMSSSTSLLSLSFKNASLSSTEFSGLKIFAIASAFAVGYMLAPGGEDTAGMVENTATREESASGISYRESTFQGDRSIAETRVGAAADTVSSRELESHPPSVLADELLMAEKKDELTERVAIDEKAVLIAHADNPCQAVDIISKGRGMEVSKSQYKEPFVFPGHQQVEIVEDINFFGTPFREVESEKPPLKKIDQRPKTPPFAGENVEELVKHEVTQVKKSPESDRGRTDSISGDSSEGKNADIFQLRSSEHSIDAKSDGSDVSVEPTESMKAKYPIKSHHLHQTIGSAHTIDQYGEDILQSTRSVDRALHCIKNYSNLDIDPFHDACREIKIARDAVSIAEKEAQAYLAKDDFYEGDLPHLITLDLAFSALKKAVEKTMAAAETSLRDRSKYSQELTSTALAPMREAYQAQDTLFANSLKKSISVREIPLSSLEFQKKALESAIHSTEKAVRYGEDYINNFLELENDEAAQIFVLTESDSSSAHIHQVEEAQSKLQAAKATAIIAIENAKDYLEQHIASDDITINSLDKDVLFEALNITAAALSRSTYQVKCALKNVEKYRHLYPDDVEKIITKIQQLDTVYGITSDIRK